MVHRRNKSKDLVERIESSVNSDVDCNAREDEEKSVSHEGGRRLGKAQGLATQERAGVWVGGWLSGGW